MLMSKNRGSTRLTLSRPLLILIGLVVGAPLLADNVLVWDTKSNRINADIEGWPLSRLLTRISELTHWQVFVEPGSSHTVSTRFQNQPTSEALDRLLGKLSFALVPQKSGSAKLLVFRTSAISATERVKPPRSARRDRRIRNELILTVPADFPEKYAKALIRAAGLCSVKKSILSNPEFDIRAVNDK